MKPAMLALALLVATSAFAQGEHKVREHTTKNGTTVHEHYQTNPDATKNNNWSHDGNVNPHTGKEGKKKN
jgi:hypothetical protein